MKNVFVPLVIAATCCIPAIAQDAGPPPVIQIIRESIKEGRSAAHEKVETDYARMFRKNKFPFHYLALTSMTGPGEAWFVSAFPSFAAVEESDKEFQKPAFKAENDLLDARDGELRSISRNMYAVYRKDMSYQPEQANVGKTRYVNIESFRVKLGHTEDFMTGSKMFVAAFEKAKIKAPMLAYQVVAGAPEGLFLFIQPMESLKTFDEMPARQKALMDAMGAENFQRMMKGSGDVFTSTENSLFSVNPKMSYVSKETEDVDPAFWRPKVTSAKPAADTKVAEKTGQ
jgi:hypothetical protein